MVRAPTQCISHHILGAWVVVYVKVILRDGVQPPSLTLREVRLLEKVANSLVVSVQAEVSAQQVVPPFLESSDHSQELLLMDQVSLLRIFQPFAEIGNNMTLSTIT
jgi:hypothetical protein